jgi:hypothetical protein
LLTYNKGRSEYLTDITNTKEYWTSEQGAFTSTVNNFFLVKMNLVLKWPR